MATMLAPTAPEEGLAAQARASWAAAAVPVRQAAAPTEGPLPSWLQAAGRGFAASALLHVYGAC